MRNHRNSLLNPEFLSQYEELGREEAVKLIDELIRNFLLQAPRRIEAVRQAIAAGDLDAIRRSAHALKNAGASLGADAMVKGCQRLESLAEDGITPPMEELLGQVSREVDTLCLALNSKSIF